MPRTLSNAGQARLKGRTNAGRWVYAGPFPSLGGARRMAQDLATGAGIREVRVEHRNRGSWRPAWRLGPQEG